MGCDVHGPWIEQRSPWKNDDGEYRWSNVGKLHMSRNYRLFALMAEVRKHWPLGIIPNEHVAKVMKDHGVACDEDFEKLSKEEQDQMAKEAQDNGITLGQPSFEAKGMPKDIGIHIAEEYLLYVSENEEIGEEGFCTKSQAESWVKSGSSEVWDREPDGKVTRITGPDWHSASWLSTAEVEELVARYQACQEALIPYAQKEMEESKKTWQEFAEKAQAEGRPVEVIERAKKYAERASTWEFHNPMNEPDLRQLRTVLAMMRALETPDEPCRICFYFDN